MNVDDRRLMNDLFKEVGAVYWGQIKGMKERTTHDIEKIQIPAFNIIPSQFDSSVEAMKYQNPPVVAVGITFTFPPLSSEQWEGCVKYLNEVYGCDFVDKENVLRDNIQVLSRSEGGAPTSLKGETRTMYVNFRDANKQMFAIGRDFLTYYRLRPSQEDYPHFQIVLPKALSILSELNNIAPETVITQVSVTYMDDLHFPISEGESFDLSEYMLLGISIPRTEDFGPIFDFNCRLSHQLSGGEKGGLQIQFARTETDKKEYRMQVFWTCQIVVDNITSSEEKSLTEKLNLAHKYCGRCFESSLTDKARMLFKPLPEQTT